jgi:CBS domain-containing protein
MSSIEQVMHRPVCVCGIDQSANDAAKTMWERDIGAVVVVDDDGRVAGIVTDRDVCMAAYTRGVSLPEIPLRLIMTQHVMTCRPSDPIDQAERLMADNQVRRVPVVDGAQRPVGMLSLNDLARAAKRSGPSHAKDVDDVAHTLAAICEPRQPDQRSA